MRREHAASRCLQPCLTDIAFKLTDIAFKHIGQRLKSCGLGLIRHNTQHLQRDGPHAAPVLLLVLGVSLLLVGWRQAHKATGTGQWRQGDTAARYSRGHLLISYAYHEKDAAQLEYFLAVGARPAPFQPTLFSIVVSGGACTPCHAWYPYVSAHEQLDMSDRGIKDAYHGPHHQLLFRSHNIGMDLAAHNATLEYVRHRRLLKRFRYFIFLNSSAAGPFMPSWVPPAWHWPHAFLERLEGDVRAVGASLVCLPEVDAGGPGPRLESWAFALDALGLEAALQGGVFHVRACKVCRDADGGIVVGGEYALSASMFRMGYNVATLLSKYKRGVDWRDRAHWGCNNNVHPSRAGTYEGISMHPYETLFVKATWHVAEPYTTRYSRWVLQQVQLGDAGTRGSFDEALYWHAISSAAQQPHDLELAYRAVPQALGVQQNGSGL